MAEIIPGTGGLMVMHVGTPRARPSLNLPALTVPQDRQPNHVLIITGGGKGLGRNGLTNFTGSTLRRIGREFAIVELASSLGSASRAHKNENVAVDLVSPLLRQDWPGELADLVDSHFERTVIVSVHADMWIPFARIEPALLSTIGGARPVAYAFVDPTGAAARLHGHLKWLKQRGLPAFEHRLVLRGVPQYPPRTLPTPAYSHHMILPYFEPALADQVFERITTSGQLREFSTFHAAWARTTIGPRSMMFARVAAAMLDIVRLLEAASYQLEQENG